MRKPSYQAAASRLQQRTSRAYHGTPSLRKTQPPPSLTSSIKPLYIDSSPTTPLQLTAATNFFASHLPTKSWTATEWRQQPHSESTFLAPEIVFLGRSNSGKSSLLNALLNDKNLCRVGPKPGKTIVMHAWSLAPIPPKTIGAKKRFQGDLDPKLTVLDMPGYGHGSHADWGKDIVKYLTRRRQLRRAFVLVNPVHGLKKSDLQTLELLRSNGISHQLIACKCDEAKASQLPSLLQNIGRTVERHFDKKDGGITLMTLNDILAVGYLGDGKLNARVMKGKMAGVDDVRWAIIRATGLEEYAMALVGGVKIQEQTEVPQSLQRHVSQFMPAPVIPEPTVPMEALHIPIQIQQDPPYEMLEPEPTNTSPTPETKQAPSTNNSGIGIGIGIDEFMAMTDSLSKPKAARPSTPRRHESSSRAGAGRREQLRHRRQATNMTGV
ncbi:hypothetical protein H2198_001031 [Neophaeococcomyces mojaviensis]|uniref:Uncharacterized protein n=1 Tax=Neophaeococcomyces mojaviensis TaxID=3383035 RepID=A0ACC3AIR7_9EURO|nr:hypothetical protein H2198_001031 [Knufia sp. JES_112]